MEVNGAEVHTPVELQHQLQKSMGSVTFKIRPSNTDLIAPAQVSIFVCLYLSIVNMQIKGLNTEFK